MDPRRKKKAAEEGGVSPPPSRKRKIESATTKDAVDSFFTPASRKLSGTITWTTIDSTLLVAHFISSSKSDERPHVDKSRKIAAFDLDSTLIKGASGKRSKAADDWMWWHPSVLRRLKALDNDGYRIVIFSNQGGLNLKMDSNTAKIDGKRVTDFKAKITSILNQLDVSLSFYAATERDRYRKPRTGAWLELLEHFDLDSKLDGVDLEGSMFVGDAGGRTSSDRQDEKEIWAKDFASSDLDFASNVGIKFLTPDEFFLGKPPRRFQRTFDPGNYLDIPSDLSPFKRANPQDIVCLAGSPGAGKSTFYWNHLAILGYERVNQDQLKTRDRCLEAAGEFLKSGKSVAVDNTNADPETRAHWMKLAKAFQIPIRCVCLKSEPKLCEHNDAVRALNKTLMNPEGRTRLPVLAFVSFAKRFRQPILEEGFQDITTVDFRFVGTKEQEAAWTQFYI